MRTKYSDALQALWDASGEVETIINGLPDNNPTPNQSGMLSFCQDLLKKAIQNAARDPQLPDMPIPGTQPRQ